MKLYIFHFSVYIGVMDHLSKQQLVLLALLVSFMTSLATGIVTVSLMDQAPQGVTRTVSQVIEKTIQQAAPQNAAVGTVTLNVDDQLATAVAKVSSSVVNIEDVNSHAIVGFGLVVSKDGVIMVNKSVVNQFSNYSAVLSDGTVVPIDIFQGQSNGDVAFFKSALPAGSSTVFTPIDAAFSFSLGQSVFSLAGTSTAILGQGIITDMTSTSSPIGTSISAERAQIGSPLFDILGNVIGIRMSSISADPSSMNDGAVFSPIAPLMDIMLVVK